MFEIRIEEDFFAYCNSKLTPTQYLVYLACRFIGEVETSRKEIYELCGISTDSLKTHLPNLKKKGFVNYARIDHKRIHIRWIRLKPQGLMPETFDEQHYHYLVDPQGKQHRIPIGRMRGFCRKHGLNRNCITQMMNGRQKSHLGWTI